MDECKKSDRAFDHLGLPPMELAESSGKGRCNILIFKYIFPFLQKIMIILMFIVFCASTYIVLIRLLDSTDSSKCTEIVVLAERSVSPNVTVQRGDKDNLPFINKTPRQIAKRKKRHVKAKMISSEETISMFRDEDYLKAREIIMKHKLACGNENHQDICKDLVMKLKAITESRQEDSTMEGKEEESSSSESKSASSRDTTSEVAKRESHAPLRAGGIQNDAKLSAIHPPSHSHGSLQLTDTCLLARLLNQNYPSVKGIYDVPVSDFALSPHYDHPNKAINRYYLPPWQSHLQNRGISAQRRQMHPQDLDIIMSFLTPRPDTFSTDKLSTNSSIRKSQCSAGSVPCADGGGCVTEKQWCDGKVDCSDVSDELRCGCKSRVDESRLCDGYFDCPFGEDEMDCNGCKDNTFSCEDLDMNSMSTCFTLDQRCNNVVDCPNHKDELECSMLAPSLHKKPLYAISNTEGFLHRNFKGKWYPVCRNPYMWAHDACRRETGHLTRPPSIEIVPIDPLMKVTYMNSGIGGLLETSNACFNSSAMYVNCPELLCGTRVMSTSQLLKENLALENHLFGRNKRFLYPSHPYPMMFYGSRMKRHVGSSSHLRDKRTESRVVGGKPSQPAAWPWMVAIYRNGMFHCGGVVLSQSWVMSAAHCVTKFWDHYYEIQVGMLRRFSFSPQEQNHRVTHVIVNQHYSQTDMKSDLSLLRVDPEIQYSRWIRPICLPSPDSAGPDWLWGPAPGTICTAVGWGATVEHGPDPDHMREVEVPIWEECTHKEDRAGNEICAGFVEGGKDACQGDSGGPLLCRNALNSQQWYMAGIVSHGDGCARKGEPGVYTRVSLFVKWIRYHISSKSLPIVQPLQECPGFKCESGISRCLPTKRKCDKIIDCLDGEDEINCNFMRSADTIANNTPNTTEVSDSGNNNHNKNEVDVETTTLLKITELDSGNSINTINSKHSINTKTKQQKGFNSMDFEHASTIEIAHSSESDSEEQVTMDPSTTSKETETEESDRGDMHIFTVSYPKTLLESRSSVLKETANSFSTEPTNDSTTQDVEDNWIVTNNPLQGNIDTTTILLTQQPDLDSNKLEHVPGNDADSISLDTINKEMKSKSMPNENVIELLPNSHSTLSDNITESGTKETHLIEHTTFSNVGSKVSGKKLFDFDDKKDIIHKIEDIVFSELQPAKIRRKHRTPLEFECQRIFQKIPFHQRCDHKADCEDGTDELGCSCNDYLSTFDDKLLCDGIFDCADGQDEADCYNCEEERFLCKRSHICLPMKYVCDGTPQCPEGEDELDCFALTNGKEIINDFDNRPKVNLDGYLTRRHRNEWHVACKERWTIDQQERAANHICRYLGFSAANRFYVKYIDVKDEDITQSILEDNRKRRETNRGLPVHFAYMDASEEDNMARHIVIEEPQVLKEHCVPNVTKTCKSLYVFCERALYTNFDIPQNILFNRETESITNHMWPWAAKIYAEGEYKCTGILVDLSWVLVSQSCLWDMSSLDFMTAVLGSHRTHSSTNGLYEQIRQIDVKKDIYISKVILLHLKTAAIYSNMVKPMVLMSGSMPEGPKELCVAVGQDNRNNTLSVFLEETNTNCNSHNRCFVRKRKENLCDPGLVSRGLWAGVIGCLTEQGWYPAASFVDSRGECGIGDHITGNYIQNLKNEIRFFSVQKPSESMEQYSTDDCEGQRCSRGRCMPLRYVCDSVKNCEDGSDESDEACKKKQSICDRDPYHKGCECTPGQLKCRNGKCVSKEVFRDGRDDCGDGTDEPGRTSCSDYLARVMPSRLCDGILHCHDRSDEDPMYCKCYAKSRFECGSKLNDVEHCVAPDMVCDGVKDCPSGEDEKKCIGLKAPLGTPSGTGQVIVRSHGVWHSKCYPTHNHTRSELEAICRELGFFSGHAKEIKSMEIAHPHNNVLLDPFSEVMLNNNTIIKMRNTAEPIARSVFDEKFNKCYPVFIECL